MMGEDRVRNEGAFKIAKTDHTMYYDEVNDQPGKLFEVDCIKSEWVWIEPPSPGKFKPVDCGEWYEIKWDGYDDDENTMQMISTLKHCPEVIEYWNEHNILGSLPNVESI
eukprot:297790_1